MTQGEWCSQKSDALDQDFGVPIFLRRDLRSSISQEANITVSHNKVIQEAISASGISAILPDSKSFVNITT